MKGKEGPAKGAQRLVMMKREVSIAIHSVLGPAITIFCPLIY